ncbi:MAG: hypothetical protein U0457_13740 [Candidatus Sericytochromatia bacterium]
MPKIMKPVTFGCENGFQEVFFDSDNPSEEQGGNVYCYLSRLSEEDKKDSSCVSKCAGMKASECWKA